MLRAFAAVTTAALFLAFALRAGSDAPPSDEATKATMHELYGAVSELLPRCLSNERFQAPADREVVKASLAKLAQSADALSTHLHGAGPDELSFRGAALARDARRAQARFDSGRPVDARFTALALTEACVGCHSRLPAEKSAAFSSGLTAKIDPAALSPSERARLDVATRQFDAALGEYEALLVSPSPEAGEAIRMADLTEYLIVAIRVVRAPERAEKLLAKLEKRAQTLETLREQLGPWRAQLTHQGHVVRDVPSLAVARRLVDAGKAARSYAYSRAGIIYDLLASSVLHRLLEEPKLAAGDRAEAYYLVGLTDSNARSSPWLSDGAWYLDAAIHTKPHSPVAVRAFEAYEDMTLLEWTGSAGTQLPDDVVADLDRLRALAQPEAKSL
ncbi:MAG TPA: hypothetical protein VMR31_16620 [Myxococcota bacterium]|nr:hypothetical protein [Myxococcota bacterium]